MATPEEICALEESNTDLSKDEIKTMMLELKRATMENEEFKKRNEEFKKRQKPITFSVSEKGGVSIHGIGKFPFTLYRAQWERILENSNELKAFIKDNLQKLN